MAQLPRGSTPALGWPLGRMPVLPAPRPHLDLGTQPPSRGWPPAAQGTIFEHMFGGGFGGAQRARRGQSVRTVMTISFHEAVKGTSQARPRRAALRRAVPGAGAFLPAWAVLCCPAARAPLAGRESRRRSGARAPSHRAGPRQPPGRECWSAEKQAVAASRPCPPPVAGGGPWPAGPAGRAGGDKDPCGWAGAGRLQPLTAGGATTAALALACSGVHCGRRRAALPHALCCHHICCLRGPCFLLRAGVDNGFQLRVAGKGAPGPKGAPPGDLHVVVQVRGPDMLVP